MKIFDSFLFFNELSLLEIRLNTLYDIVDYFVLVEADKTFTGDFKPYYFEENIGIFGKFTEKIIHIKLSEYPYTNNAWEMERFQREQISLGFINCNPEDIILISDLDEIPNPKAIFYYINNLRGIYSLRQMQYVYFLNFRRCGGHKYWYNAKILRYNDITVNNLSPQSIRWLNEINNKKIQYIKNGGWHYSFLGGIESIIYKIKSFSHQEYNTNAFLNENLNKKIRLGKDLFDRKDRRLIPIQVNSINHSEYLINNINLYDEVIYKNYFKYISILNRLYSLQFYPIRVIKLILKTILPKKILYKIRKNQKQ